MQYVANPIVVTAYKITRSEGPYALGEYIITLENGELHTATKEMVSRIMPRPGDYWVIQSDGYVYLNPRDVFHRKYSSKPRTDG